MILDVGCGVNPRGDVNCDLFTGESPHLRGEYITARDIPNFVKCDAQFLPFKSNAFSTVIASHLLEHCKHPFDVLREFQRVTSHGIIIEVPSLRRTIIKEAPTHLFTWSEYSLRNLMEQFFSDVEIYDAYKGVRGRILRRIPFFGSILCKMLQRLITDSIIGTGIKTYSTTVSSLERNR